MSSIKQILINNHFNDNNYNDWLMITDGTDFQIHKKGQNLHIQEICLEVQDCSLYHHRVHLLE